MTEVLTAVGAAIVSAFIFIRFSAADKKEKAVSYIKNNDLVFARILLVYFAVDLLVIHLSGIQPGTYAETANSIILINAMIMLSVTDIRYRCIPNIYLVFLVLIRCVIIALQILLYKETGCVISRSLTGLAAGFCVMMMIYLISRKNIGAGDVKMYSVIGFFAGGSGIMDILVYSSVFCAAAGLIMLMSRKYSMKSLIPMAPFACLGSVAYFIIGAVK